MKGFQRLCNIIVTLLALLNSPVLFAENVIPDSGIISEVQNKLIQVPSVVDLPVVITSNKGIITLTGDVQTDSQASDLIEAVSSVPGVIDVDTAKLNVKEIKQSFPDTVITAKIKGTLLKEKVFGDKTFTQMGVNIETHNGVVRLTGTVETAGQLAAVLSVVRRVSGKESLSQLVVNPTK